jgi:hypothetical protein
MYILPSKARHRVPTRTAPPAKRERVARQTDELDQARKAPNGMECHNCRGGGRKDSHHLRQLVESSMSDHGSTALLSERLHDQSSALL